MLSHESEIKGIPDGFEAFLIAKKKFPQLELSMFGVREARKDMPKGTTYFQNPDQSQIRKIYSNTDIYLFPSRQEGFGLTPMEAMACGAAVVTTNVGGIPDYTIPNETALVVEPKKPQQLTEAIIKLIENPSILEKIARKGQEHIQQFCWENATKEFEKALLNNI